MGVSRSGYYKWLGREPDPHKAARSTLVECISKVHEEHRSHGYRWTAAYIRINEGYNISDNYAYRIFRHLGIRAETRHRTKYTSRRNGNRYENLIFSTWETVDSPRQVIVSDMTAFHISWFYIELTMYFDVFTKQIVSYRFGTRRGDRMQYINGLNDVIEMLRAEGCHEPVVLHTDQGSVYSSIAYNDLIKDCNIVRSMSRPGKPTDNPVNESLNGWIKEELYMDFKIGECISREEVTAVIDSYVIFYNSKRPCYALGYDTPDNFFRRFMSGEMEKKNSFANRKPSPIPKFVRKRLEESTSSDP